MKIQYLVFEAEQRGYGGYDKLYFELNLCPGARTTFEVFERLRRPNEEYGTVTYFIFIKTEKKVEKPRPMQFKGLKFIFVTPDTFISMRNTMRYLNKQLLIDCN
jgi:hypothetical protein